MGIKNAVIKSKEIYSNEWKYTAEFYSEKGYYDLLAKSIPHGANVLEIGLGSGHSTLAISNREGKVIAIDENEFCLSEAHTLLTSHDIDSVIKRRGDFKINDDPFSYQIKYSFINSLPKNRIVCLEGNINNDEELLHYLENKTRIDVITCWLMGGHGLILNEVGQRIKGRGAEKRTPLMVRNYKFDVLRSVAKASVNLLKENGFIHVVERIIPGALDHYTKHDLFNIYEEIFLEFDFILNGKESLIPIETKSLIEMSSDYKGEKDKMLLMNMMFIKK